LTKITDITPEKIADLLGDIEKIYIVEECVTGGCLASKIALDFSTYDSGKKIIAINLGNEIIPSASVGELMKRYSLDAEGIVYYITKTIL